MYFKINLFNHTFSVKFNRYKVINLNFLIVKTPDKETYGITSRCKDGKHILFFDYDGLKFTEMKDELNYLQREYGLSKIYLFELDRPNSYHAICLDKFTLYKAIEIISNSSADRGFKKAPLIFRQKRWVLRISTKGERAKPKFIATIFPEQRSFRNTSSSHRNFLNEWYGLKIKKTKLDDKFEESFEICGYNTGANC